MHARRSGAQSADAPPCPRREPVNRSLTDISCRSNAGLIPSSRSPPIITTRGRACSGTDLGSHNQRQRYRIRIPLALFMVARVVRRVRCTHAGLKRLEAMDAHPGPFMKGTEVALGPCPSLRVTIPRPQPPDPLWKGGRGARLHAPAATPLDQPPAEGDATRREHPPGPARALLFALRTRRWSASCAAVAGPPVTDDGAPRMSDAVTSASRCPPGGVDLRTNDR
jgi:hypothetical protein